MNLFVGLYVDELSHFLPDIKRNRKKFTKDALSTSYSLQDESFKDKSMPLVVYIVQDWSIEIQHDIILNV
jgi:hypothetical protein